MIIKKLANELYNYFDFQIINDNKILSILFSGNLDLYITLSNGQILSQNKSQLLTFDIKSENRIYDLFEKLYTDIIHGNISEEINYKNTLEYKKLVDKKQNIIWISDDEEIDLADTMIISKEKNLIRLTFIRRKTEYEYKNPIAISIRIRNARSKYKPFNVLFMDLYNNLQQVENNKVLKKDCV